MSETNTTPEDLNIETRDKAEYIFKLIKPTLEQYYSKEWKGPRYLTEWGSKTEEGLIESIGRVIATKNECLPKIE